MLFSLLKHYFNLYISDTALKVSQSLYCFTTFVCHGVENHFQRLWDMGISDAILLNYVHPTIIFAFPGIRHPSRLISGHFKEKYLSYLYQIWYGC